VLEGHGVHSTVLTGALFGVLALTMALGGRLIPRMSGICVRASAVRSRSEHVHHALGTLRRFPAISELD
jgi:hypothetical protein